MANFEMVDRRFVTVSSMIFLCMLLLTSVVSAHRPSKGRQDHLASVIDHEEKIQEDKAFHFLWQTGKSSYQRVWPEIKFGWRIIVGTAIGFLGAALGSVGGVGGGGIFVPMLTLVIGFDPKSSTAISKCMIMGAAASTVFHNLRLRHPTLDMPIIDYDLALLLQPMLMLGISFGVTFNVIFADWMVTVLLIILFIATSMKAFFRGIDTWKKESLLKQAFHEEDKQEESEAKSEEGSGGDYVPIPGGPAPAAPSAGAHDTTVSLINTGIPAGWIFTSSMVPMLSNIYWKELFLLLFVWMAFLAVQIIKTQTVTCSLQYWILYALQVPIAASVTLFEAVCLYKGKRVIASRGKEVTNWKVHQILFYCFCGIVAGMVGGLLGLGGGFILGPLFLELGIPPQVASATSTFSMVFSSSMSVVQYYILKRFPVPYATYFIFVATLAASVGQHVVRKLIAMLGRVSIIVFILATIIFISAITLGGVGIANMIEKLHNREYMGFEDLCS